MLTMLSSGDLPSIETKASVAPRWSVLDQIVQQANGPELASPAIVRVGVVTKIAGGSLAVQLQGEQAEREAVQAASCLLEAGVDDLVSCLCVGGKVWVQHILSKSSGPLHPPIAMAQGELSIHADAVRVAARSTVAIQADRICQQSRISKESAEEKLSDVAGNRVEYSRNWIARASQHANIKADSMTQVAVSLLKIDGAQVHMG